MAIQVDEKALQVLLAGSGGQGLGLAGKILAEAACLHCGLEAVQKQSYGARARGGYSQSTVTICREEILCPILEQHQVLIALTQSGYDQGLKRLAVDGLVIFDREWVKPGRASLAIQAHEEGFPFFEEAVKLGNERGITIMALGAMVGLTGIVTPEGVENAMADNLAAKILEPNRQCFFKGLELAQERKNGNDRKKVKKSKTTNPTPE